MEALLRGTEIIFKNEEDCQNSEECKNNLMMFISNFIEGEKSMPSVTCLKIVIVLLYPFIIIISISIIIFSSFSRSRK